MDVRIGSINGGHTVIGDHGRITVHPAPAALDTAVAALVAALRQHRDELADPDAVRAAVATVREEAKAPRPNRERLSAALRDLAAGAGGVTAVADATQAVAALVQNLS
ncbi:DUF5955 family protein [Actinoplanes sp. DH11]|uniref:DUF5955 family protein n=1 Tax=Actinoplanes sp. DH11 TaxID=2857011 RepID=UPI001E32B254|nr:DUF5955 family protein [Actinoplanes sp. DH11]